jgi:hypothetical protein
MLYMPKMNQYKMHTTNCVHKLINYKIINNTFDNIGGCLKIQKDFIFNQVLKLTNFTWYFWLSS